MPPQKTNIYFYPRKGGDFPMKEKKLFDSITDEFLKESRETKLKRRSIKGNKWLVTTASVVLILGIGFLLSKGNYDSLDKGPILDVIYPKAYAFEDDETRFLREQNPVDKSFIAAINDFSYKTGSLILNDSGINTNYSPLSLYYALAVAATGAENETEAELLNLLGVTDNQELAEQSGNLYRILYKDNKIGKLKIANSIWLDDDMNGEKIEFKDGFVSQVAKNFYASSHSVDFNNSKTGVAMAQWVSTNTNGTLSPTIETDPDQILSILNTVYFCDEWIDRFDKYKTKEDIFYLSNSSKVNADFMNQTFGSARFTKGNGFTRAGLSLKNSGQMVFILPDEGVSPYELIASPDEMKQTFEGGESVTGEVVWKIPKFSFESKFTLINMLKNLGVNSAFTADADFSGVTDNMAYITDVKQETHIAIDEDGVEASAFTQIDFAGAALPEGRADMILNRPFIYGITAENGSLLFVGVCENPAE